MFELDNLDLETTSKQTLSLMDGDAGENRRKFGMLSSYLDFGLIKKLSENRDQIIEAMQLGEAVKIMRSK